MTRGWYRTTGGYESRCLRHRIEEYIRLDYAITWSRLPRCEAFSPPGGRGWVPWMRPVGSYHGAAITDDNNLLAQMRCADGDGQCTGCARTLRVREVREFMDSVPPGPCVYCGNPDGRTVDHVIAQARNGPDEPSNLVRACRRCNSSKGPLSVRAWLVSGRPQAAIARRHAREIPGQVSLL